MHKHIQHHSIYFPLKRFEYKIHIRKFLNSCEMKFQKFHGSFLKLAGKSKLSAQTQITECITKNKRFGRSNNFGEQYSFCTNNKCHCFFVVSMQSFLKYLN